MATDDVLNPQTRIEKKRDAFLHRNSVAVASVIAHCTKRCTRRKHLDNVVDLGESFPLVLELPKSASVQSRRSPPPNVGLQASRRRSPSLPVNAQPPTKKTEN